jgi:DNA (cytosine-5)-methyltransferase 1
MGNADGAGLERRRLPDGERRNELFARSAGVIDMADAEHESRCAERVSSEGERSHSEPDQRSVFDVAGAFPPGPGDVEQWRAILERFPELSPAIEPGFRFMANGMAVMVDERRTDALRMLGNGVVPLQAAAALVVLARRARIRL